MFELNLLLGGKFLERATAKAIQKVPVETGEELPGMNVLEENDKSAGVGTRLLGQCLPGTISIDFFGTGAYCPGKVGLILGSLILEFPVKNSSAAANRVLLTIDITPAVCDEAISHGVSMIVSYHTPILSGWKSLTLATPLQGSLLRCAESRSTAPKVLFTVFSVASTTGWQNV
ncbi:hypothetical protein C8R44DRAFT_858514, partial [Mycena epipterygia]